MKPGEQIWTERLIAEIDKSVRTIVAQKFPRLSFADREDVLQEVQFKIWKMLTSGKKIVEGCFYDNPGCYRGQIKGGLSR